MAKLAKIKLKVERCRVCLSENGDMFYIFKKDEPIMISTKIMNLAKVRIYPNDGLPAAICSICLTKLNNCIEFIQLCELSDTKLRASDVDTKEASNPETKNFVNARSNDLKCEFKEELDVKKIVRVDKSKDDKSLSFINSGSNNKKKRKKKKYKTKEIRIRQQCNICGRVMSSMYRLKTHFVTHSGERPFSCQFCSKDFTTEENLKVHSRIHTGEKPYRCSECGKSFAQSSGLITHKRKHTGQLPYKCLLCPRSFRTIGHMQYHTKQHTGEKIFECDQCNRSFITRGDLKHHRATHSGDRPYVCSICGLRLTRAWNLSRHMQKFHKVNTDEPQLKRKPTDTDYGKATV